MRLAGALATLLLATACGDEAPPPPDLLRSPHSHDDWWKGKAHGPAEAHAIRMQVAYFPVGSRDDDHREIEFRRDGASFRRRAEWRDADDPEFVLTHEADLKGDGAFRPILELMVETGFFDLEDHPSWNEYYYYMTHQDSCRILVEREDGSLLKGVTHLSFGNPPYPLAFWAAAQSIQGLEYELMIRGAWAEVPESDR